MAKYIDADVLMEYLQEIKQQAETDNKTKIDALESTIDVINTTIIMKTDEIMQIVGNMPAADVEPCNYDGEYIRKDDVINLIDTKCIDGCLCNDEDCLIGAHGLVDEIDDLPAADVEPVRKWISVDERLPAPGERTLIYAYDGHSMRISISNYAKKGYGWILSGTTAYWKVKAWQPLPEPPKNGRR